MQRGLNTQNVNSTCTTAATKAATSRRPLAAAMLARAVWMAGGMDAHLRDSVGIVNVSDRSHRFAQELSAQLGPWEVDTSLAVRYPHAER